VDNIFVRDLPDWIKNSIKMFADDTKIRAKIAVRVDSLQEDLNRFIQWSGKWLLKFNPDKYKVMDITYQRVTMKEGDKIIELNSTEEEKDLGVGLFITKTT